MSLSVDDPKGASGLLNSGTGIPCALGAAISIKIEKQRIPHEICFEGNNSTVPAHRPDFFAQDLSFLSLVFTLCPGSR